MPGRFVDPRFPNRMRDLLDGRAMSFRALAAHTYYGKSYLRELAAGKKTPTLDAARRIDEALDAGGELAALVCAERPAAQIDDELDALDLAARVAASDLGSDTLDRLQRAADELAVAYATTPPEQLLPRVRRQLAYMGMLLDAHKALSQHRRLLVTGGWLALLGATVQIDLRQRAAAEALLETARHMAEQAEHAEIRAWCLETRAWDVLTSGDYQYAVDLSQKAQAVAPVGSSAHIQATAQEGRAWARMGRRLETHDALNRVAGLVASLSTPERPEHHYQYDPAKSLSYTATTLAWVGDPAAEEYARAVVGQLEAVHKAAARPRRVASARLDLGLALLVAGKPDEAGAVAVSAITSGRIVPSNWWRATEIVAGVERTGIREAVELRDAYHAYRPTPGG